MEREFNLSYMDALPAHNEIAAGRWLDPAADELSVEQGIAERLAGASVTSSPFNIAASRCAAASRRCAACAGLDEGQLLRHRAAPASLEKVTGELYQRLSGSAGKGAERSMSSSRSFPT